MNPTNKATLGVVLDTTGLAAEITVHGARLSVIGYAFRRGEIKPAAVRPDNRKARVKQLKKTLRSTNPRSRPGGGRPSWNRSTTGYCDPTLRGVDGLTVPPDFCGVIAVDRAGEPLLRRAYGLANRACAVPNRDDTRFALASGSKGFVAVAVASLIESGDLRLDTTARSVLGVDLPLVAADVTVEQLLAHRSGIGDYLDEDGDFDVTDHVLSEPVHRLDRTEAFLSMLDGRPTVFPAGERFKYCNSGYVVLALILERVSGVPFHDVIASRVFGPAGMTDAAYLRSDELPPNTATGYLYADGLRSNVLHLPVRGNGDGGAYSTVANISAFWRALFAGAIVSPAFVAEMVRPRTARANQDLGYGLGFWLRPDGRVQLAGYDAGVSFRSVHDRDTATTWTVVSNWSGGAWPVARQLIR